MKEKRTKAQESYKSKEIVAEIIAWNFKRIVRETKREEERSQEKSFTFEKVERKLRTSRAKRTI